MSGTTTDLNNYNDLILGGSSGGGMSFGGSTSQKGMDFSELILGEKKKAPDGSAHWGGLPETDVQKRWQDALNLHYKDGLFTQLQGDDSIKANMALADIMMVGVPTWGETNLKYPGREDLLKLAKSGKGIPDFLQYIEESQGPTTRKEREAAVQGFFKMGPKLPSGETISSLGIAQGVNYVVNNFPKIIRGGLTAFSMMGESDEAIWSEIDDIEKLAGQIPATRAADGVSRVLQYFIPYVGQLTIASDTGEITDRAKEKGLPLAIQEEVLGTLQGINVFEPGLGWDERLVRGVGLAVAGYGAFHSVKKAQGIWEGTKRGLAKAGATDPFGFGKVMSEAMESAFRDDPVLNDFIDGRQTQRARMAQNNPEGIQKRVANATLNMEDKFREVVKVAAAGDSDQAAFWNRVVERASEESERSIMDIAKEESTKPEWAHIADEAMQNSADPEGFAAKTNRQASEVVREQNKKNQERLDELTKGLTDDEIELRRKKAAGETKEFTEPVNRIKKPTSGDDLATMLYYEHGFGRDESRAVADIYQARAEAWAEHTGNSVENWFSERFAGFGNENTVVAPHEVLKPITYKGADGAESEGHLVELGENQATVVDRNTGEDVAVSREAIIKGVEPGDSPFERVKFGDEGVSPESPILITVKNEQGGESKYFELTGEKAREYRQAKAELEKQATNSPDPTPQKNRFNTEGEEVAPGLMPKLKLNAASKKFSAKVREITGYASSTEKRASAVESGALDAGRTILTPDGTGTSLGSQYGRVRVKLETGEIKSYARGDLAELESGATPGGVKEITQADYDAGVKAGKATTNVLGKQPNMPNVKGYVDFLSNGKAILRAFGLADVSTFIHELAHVMRREMIEGMEFTRQEVQAIETWAGATDGKWSRQAEEKFARGFEKYVTKSEPPTRALKTAFAKMKKWMLGIYGKLKGSAIDVDISPEVEGLFDKLLGKDVDEAKALQERQAEQVAKAEEADLERHRQELMSISPDDPRLDISDIFADEYDHDLDSEIRQILGFGETDSRNVHEIIEDAQHAQMSSETMQDFRDNLASDVAHAKIWIRDTLARKGGNTADRKYRVTKNRKTGKLKVDSRNTTDLYYIDGVPEFVRDQMIDFLDTGYSEPEHFLVDEKTAAAIRKGDKPDLYKPGEVMRGTMGGNGEMVTRDFLEQFELHLNADSQNRLYQKADPEFNAGDEVTWRNNDTDEPVKIKGFAGEKDGTKYYYVEGSGTAIPAHELIRNAGEKAGIPENDFNRDADTMTFWAADLLEQFDGKLEEIKPLIRKKFGLDGIQTLEIMRRITELEPIDRIKETYEAFNGSHKAIIQMLIDEFPNLPKSRYERAIRRALKLSGHEVASVPKMRVDPKTKLKEQVPHEEVMVVGGEDILVPVDVIEGMKQWNDRLPKLPMNVNEARYLERIAGRDHAIIEYLVQNRQEAVTNLTNHLQEVRTELETVYGKDLLNDKEARQLIMFIGEGKGPHIEVNGELAERMPYTLEDLQRDRPNDWQKLQEIAEWHRSKYDELFGLVNSVRKRFGLGEIPYRQDYMTHMAEQSTNWQKILGRVEIKPATLPFAKRNSIFNRHALRRLGEKTVFDSLANYEGYAETSLRQIHLTEPAVRHRAISRIIMRSDIERQWGSMASYFDNMGNELAKQGHVGSLDIRGVIMNDQTAQQIEFIVEQAATRVGRNSVLGNLSTAIMQTAQVPIAAAMIGPENIAAGAYARILTAKSGVDLSDASPFIQRRYGYDGKLSGSRTEKVLKFLAKPMEFIEENVARTIWQGSHIHATKAGKSPEAAIRYADKMTERTLGGRAIGEMSPIFRGNLGKLLLQFQYEVSNFNQMLMHDLPYHELDGRKLTGKELTYRAGVMAVSIWVANHAYEWLLGRRPLPDVIEALLDSIEIAGDDELGFGNKVSSVVTRLAGEALSATAGGSNAASVFFDERSKKRIFGDTEIGTFSGGTALGTSLRRIGVSATDGDGSADFAWDLTTIIGLPGGGGQLRKTIDGLQSDINGGKFDKNGKLQFPVEGIDKVRAPLFGIYSTGAGQSWLKARREKSQQRKE